MYKFWISCLFFFNDTATTEIYTLSLHDALPIYEGQVVGVHEELDGVPALSTAVAKVYISGRRDGERRRLLVVERAQPLRSEEHTSELQSRQYLVCRLLLEKKK